MAAAGDYAYVGGWYAGLGVVDVSDPTQPVVVGFYDTPGSAEAVAVRSAFPRTPSFGTGALRDAMAAEYAYVADFDAGLMILRYVELTYKIYLPLVLRAQ